MEITNWSETAETQNYRNVDRPCSAGTVCDEKGEGERQKIKVSAPKIVIGLT